MSETQKANLIGELSVEQKLVAEITNADSLIGAISPNMEGENV